MGGQVPESWNRRYQSRPARTRPCPCRKLGAVSTLSWVVARNSKANCKRVVRARSASCHVATSRWAAMLETSTPIRRIRRRLLQVWTKEAGMTSLDQKRSEPSESNAPRPLPRRLRHDLDTASRGRCGRTGGRTRLRRGLDTAWTRQPRRLGRAWLPKPGRRSPIRRSRLSTQWREPNLIWPRRSQHL